MHQKCHLKFLTKCSSPKLFFFQRKETPQCWSLWHRARQWRPQDNRLLHNYTLRFLFLLNTARALHNFSMRSQRIDLALYFRLYIAGSLVHIRIKQGGHIDLTGLCYLSSLNDCIINEPSTVERHPEQHCSWPSNLTVTQWEQSVSPILWPLLWTYFFPLWNSVWAPWEYQAK